jgi:splicing factor U2AF subunit
MAIQRFLCLTFFFPLSLTFFGLSLISILRYDDIVVDIKEECEKFGPIKSVIIPRPKDGIPSNVGKVFLEYERVEDCTKAHATLGGRLFAGKSVIAVYYDEAKFAARVY